MNQETVQKIKDAALNIEKFRNLAPSDQEWLVELLKIGSSVLLVHKILDAIAARPLSFSEIAADCDCHPQTVSQILNALAGAGVAIQLNGKTAYAPTGRPRKLAKAKL